MVRVNIISFLILKHSVSINLTANVARVRVMPSFSPWLSGQDQSVVSAFVGEKIHFNSQSCFCYRTESNIVVSLFSGRIQLKILLTDDQSREQLSVSVPP